MGILLGFDGSYPSGDVKIPMEDGHRNSLFTNEHQLPNVTKPSNIAIGRDETTGSFSTAALKEYPAAFSAALAGAIVDRFSYLHRHQLVSITPLADPAQEE